MRRPRLGPLPPVIASTTVASVSLPSVCTSCHCGCRGLWYAGLEDFSDLFSDLCFLVVHVCLWFTTQICVYESLNRKCVWFHMHVRCVEVTVQICFLLTVQASASGSKYKYVCLVLCTGSHAVCMFQSAYLYCSLYMSLCAVHCTCLCVVYRTGLCLVYCTILSVVYCKVCVRFTVQVCVWFTVHVSVWFIVRSMCGLLHRSVCGLL